MPAKKTNRLAAVAATAFTSLVAPTLVSLFTSAIKSDGPSRATDKPPPLRQAATVWPDLPPPAVVQLLPPTAAQPSPATAPPEAQPAVLARTLKWHPAK